MSVWYCIPSKRPPEEAEPILKLWRERGYRLAVIRDVVDLNLSPELTFFTKPIWGVYPGYPAAVNYLVREVIREDAGAEWLVTGGDDIEPDLNHSAEEIARQCTAHFHELHVNRTCEHAHETFGVMQPTGDRWGNHERHMGQLGSAYIDRVCGSPWMGREFCKRMYQGNGPLFEGYFHMGEDEELQTVAQKLGVLWQRPDLIHLHRHWARPRSMREDMPAFLERANSPEEWRKYKDLFQQRQAAGFPGHEPLEA